MAERTYQHQAALPSLPVPPLEQTLAAYVKSCEPLLTPAELEHTKAACREFLDGVGAQLHAALQQRGKDKRNWLEEWWEHFGYLQPRYPSAININYYCVLPGNWGPQDMSQVETAAIFTHAILKFRNELLTESYQPEKMMGKPLCMHTYSRMFNTCIIPGEECDEMKSYPHDAKHIIVLRNNSMWAVRVLDESGKALPLADILRQMEQVREQAASQNDPPVSVLTSENRTNWARARQHLHKLDATNRKSLELVERALFCIALDSVSAATYDEVSRNCLLGDGHNRWYDKPFTLVVHENGRVGLNGQHVWADAMVIVRANDYCIKYVNANFKTAFANRSALVSTTGVRAQKLQWVVDRTARSAIHAATVAIGQLIANSDMTTLQFDHFGDAFLRRSKLTPDFFMQLAIQLAHYKMHTHVPAVYETAHTRLFYHGRTETIRSLTTDSLAFVKTMESSAAASVKMAALQHAIATHKATMMKSLNGNGIDRHLMGLAILADEAGISPRPALFTDKAFQLSKTFRISSSNVSSGPGGCEMWGGFSAMYEDGYGICYALQPKSINVSITAVHSCKETSASGFKRALEQALLEMAELATQNKASKI